MCVLANLEYLSILFIFIIIIIMQRFTCRVSVKSQAHGKSFTVISQNNSSAEYVDLNSLFYFYICFMFSVNEPTVTAIIQVSLC